MFYLEMLSPDLARPEGVLSKVMCCTVYSSCRPNFILYLIQNVINHQPLILDLCRLERGKFIQEIFSPEGRPKDVLSKVMGIYN